MSNSNFPKSFQELLENNTIHTIAIPRIQRDYAQGRTDDKTARIRINFVSALCTAIKNGQKLNLDFVYGNIDKKGVLTLLDGQQRLTTLFLLHWYIAKKTNHDVELLKKFSYEIRPSTRDFCAKLLVFNPFSDPEQDLAKKESKISFKITNQKWFPLSWNKDPSIVSMLTMLDEIHAQFKETAVMWKDLSRITFYFLALKDMGLTDDLYIKMNSRGKPLTDFEHFKAELDKQLSSFNESTLANDIRKKFDTTWTDLLWEYRNSSTNTEQDTIVDDEFLRYIHFICDVIYYQNEDYYQEKKIFHEKWNEFELLEIFFKDEVRIIENFITLKNFFDCWCKENLCKIKYSTPDDFLLSFINTTENYKKNKIVTQIGKNIFQECLARYTVNFNLQQFVFLYAVTYYLQHTDKIKYLDFVRRIRIINNLIQNSEKEISPSRMKNILEHIEEILKNDKVEIKENTFNKYQLKEEQKKLALLQEHPKFRDDLSALEDHKLLYGQIGILFDFEKEIRPEHIDIAKQFIEQFELTGNINIIDTALMSIGDYSQIINNSNWRHMHQFGTRDLTIWQSLFHQKDEINYSTTQTVILKLLNTIKVEEETDIITILENIKNSFTKTCEDKKEFPFEYYYIQYNDYFNPKDKNGKMYSYFKDTYTCTILSGERKNKNTYNPYLEAALKDYCTANGTDITNEIIKIHEYFVFNTCKLFQRYKNEYEYVYKISDKKDETDEELLKEIKIKQTKGIDTENRIKKLSKCIGLILEFEQNNKENFENLIKYLEKKGIQFVDNH